MLENVIKKLFPIRDEKGRPCTFPTFGSQVFGEDGDNRALWQAGKGFYADRTADAEKLGGKAPGFYTPYTNLADNSDFEHWVAQAGIGGKHGNDTYGGDRWILTAGTISGEPIGGDIYGMGGYTNITLNGTLVQVVPSPPSVATAFVEMVSGTAEISYDASKGEIILTSAGGVIKNVLLLEGEWVEKPEYVGKGYAAEYDECRGYFQRHGHPNGNYHFGFGIHNTSTIANFIVPTQPMRVRFPNLTYNGKILIWNSAKKIEATNVTMNEILKDGAYINLVATNLTQGTACQIRCERGYIDFLADIPRR